MSTIEQRRVLVTGAAGMLGSQLLLSVPDGIATVGTDIVEGHGVDVSGVDLADPEQVEILLDDAGPFTGILHTAAFTAVDLAEEREDDARRVNGDACGVIAQAAAQRGIPLVIVSTDFVFDGSATEPYTEDHPASPLGAYGRTKFLGEELARKHHPEGTRIVRTQWLYGPRGKHFPGTILALAKERDELKVVDDQVGSPTSTLELSPALWDVLLTGEAGVYHASCEGQCSWYEFACAVVDAAEIQDVRMLPCTTEEFPRPAPRPAYSVLDCSRLTALRKKSLLPWREALLTFLGKEPEVAED